MEDYRKLGLRVGLEIHQELNTGKLFCRCPSLLREEEAPVLVRRRLHLSQSELGEVDKAALLEVSKGKEFRYEVHPDSLCLVELDEEPPHPLNQEALDIALTFSLMVGAKPVDEIHVMRKIVVDGSNTSGFQRTALIATDGKIETERGTFLLPTICLEEDAARKVEEGEDHVRYRLDRLGVPLLEVATAPELPDPQTAREVALRLGLLLRATGRVKRGLGTIRQDLNISIAGGARQEIKGVQELDLIPAVIEREVQRQLGLLRIREELRKRGARVERRFVDVSHLFGGTGSRLLREALERGDRVMALRLPGFGGLLGRELQPGRRFGTELSDRARVEGGVGGILHTDELPGYGISEEEVERLKREVGAEEGDAVVVVVGEEGRCRRALEAVARRAEEALQGVPAETRRALPDGNTEFMRPLPGAERMYPETDIPPLPLDRERLSSLRLPEPPERMKERLGREYGLPGEVAERLLLSGLVETFERLVRGSGVPARLVAFTLLETMVSLRREGVRVEGVGEEFLLGIFREVAEGRVAKEAIPDLLRKGAEGKGVREALAELGLERVSEEEVRRRVEEVVSSHLELVRERGEGAMRPLMGLLMKSLRGKVDGKVVSELLLEELRRRLGCAGS